MPAGGGQEVRTARIDHAFLRQVEAAASMCRPSHPCIAQSRRAGHITDTAASHPPPLSVSQVGRRRQMRPRARPGRGRRRRRTRPGAPSVMPLHEARRRPPPPHPPDATETKEPRRARRRVGAHRQVPAGVHAAADAGGHHRADRRGHRVRLPQHTAVRADRHRQEPHSRHGGVLARLVVHSDGAKDTPGPVHGRLWLDEAHEGHVQLSVPGPVRQQKDRLRHGRKRPVRVVRKGRLLQGGAQRRRHKDRVVQVQAAHRRLRGRRAAGAAPRHRPAVPLLRPKVQGPQRGPRRLQLSGVLPDAQVL